MTDQLLPWMALHGITYDDEVLTIEGTAPGSMSIRARRSIVSGKRLATIPKTACITKLTTKIADILAQEDLSGGLGLVIAVWYEKGIAKRSKWAGYFASMADREYLPIFWNSNELASLEGTEISKADVELDVQDVVDDYEDHVLPLVRKYGEAFRDMSEASRGLESFKRAASLVASRAFAVDASHGDGMVPLADVFNHKVAVVRLSAEYGINGVDDDDDDDNACGTDDDDDADGGDDDADGGDDDESGGDGEDRDPDDDNDQDDKNHDGEDPSPKRARVEPADSFPEVQREMSQLCDMRTANGLDLRLQIAIIDDDNDGCLHIIAASDVAGGEEVFNCYGELSNDLLLKKYGFCMAENPFSCVTLDKRLILDRIWGPDEVKLRGSASLKALHDTILSETSLLDEEEEPFLIHANGHINLALFAFFRMIVHGASQSRSRGASKEDQDILEDPMISQAMDEGVPVPLHAVLESACSRDKLHCHGVRTCLSALMDACVQRSNALHQGTACAVDLEAVRLLRASEQHICQQMIDEIEKFGDYQ